MYLYTRDFITNKFPDENFSRSRLACSASRNIAPAFKREILNARRGLLAEFPVRNEAIHSEPRRETSSCLAL